MSKSLKNYPDPNVIIDQYGADATRYMPIISFTLLTLTYMVGCSS